MFNESWRSAWSLCCPTCVHAQTFITLAWTLPITGLLRLQQSTTYHCVGTSALLNLRARTISVKRYCTLTFIHSHSLTHSRTGQPCWMPPQSGVRFLTVNRDNRVNAWLERGDGYGGYHSGEVSNGADGKHRHGIYVRKKGPKVAVEKRLKLKNNNPTGPWCGCKQSQHFLCHCRHL